MGMGVCNVTMMGAEIEWRFPKVRCGLWKGREVDKEQGM